MEALGGPAADEVGENGGLDRIGGEAALRMTVQHAKPVIEGAVEHRRLQEEFGFLPLQMSHFFDDVDPFRRVEHREEHARTLEPPIHEQEIDVPVSAAARLEEIDGTLFALETRPHFRKFRTGASALAVAAPIDH